MTSRPLVCCITIGGENGNSHEEEDAGGSTNKYWSSDCNDVFFSSNNNNNQESSSADPSHVATSSRNLIMSADIPKANNNKCETTTSIGRIDVYCLQKDNAASRRSEHHQKQQQKKLENLAQRFGRVLEQRWKLQDHHATISAHQARERRLLESQTLAQLGQWELDLTTNSLYWSDEIYSLFRVNPKEFGASYEAFLNAIHPDDRTFVDHAYTNSLKTKQPYNILHRLLFKENNGGETIRWVNEICRTEYDATTGVPLYSVGIVQDITDLKKAQEMDRLKSAFLANMSHEIRTPLNAVMGYTDLMLLEDADDTSCRLSERNRDYLKTIRNSGQLLLAVVSDILDISKIEAGQLHLDCKPFSLHQTLTMVGDSARAFQSSLGYWNTHLEQILQEADVPNLLLNASDDGTTSSDDDGATKGGETCIIEDSIVGDPQRIQQVLNNLLNNAIKFTKDVQGGGRIRYGVKLLTKRRRRLRGSGDCSSTTDDNDNPAGRPIMTTPPTPQCGASNMVLEFYVADNGVGIPKDQQKVIFEAFHQVHPSRDSHELGGTGLGLTICRRLVEMMGGEMHLESTTEGDNRGTAIYFTVPYCPVEGPCSTTSPQQQSRAKEAMPMKDNNTIHEEPSSSIEKTDLSRQSTPPQTTIATCCNDDKTKQEQLPPPSPTTETTRSSSLSSLPSLPATSLPSLPATSITPTTSGKVLVVDDNKVNLKLAVRLVNRLGYDTETAVNGKEAVDAFRADPNIGLILMDKEMPICDGLEAAREIRRIETRGHLPIVALTAAAYQEDMEACLAAGCDEYLTKPIKQGALKSVLSSYMSPSPSSGGSKDRGSTDCPAA